MTSVVSGSLLGGRVLAAGLVDILENLFSTAYGLIVMGMIILAIVFAAMTWVRTRSLVPVLGALLLGGLVVIMVSRFEWLANRIGEDVDELDKNPVGTEVDKLERPTERESNE